MKKILLFLFFALFFCPPNALAVTRFYLQSGAASTPSIAPPFGARGMGAQWDTVPSAIRRIMRTTKLVTAQTDKNTTESTAITTSPTYVGVAQFISDPLEETTIDGTVAGQMQWFESNGSANHCFAVKIYVIDYFGVNITGILYDGFPASLTSEFSLTPHTNRNFPPSSAVSSLHINNGDRIVFEVGFSVFNTEAISRVATMRYGDDQADDLPVNQTDTTTTKDAWVEFSQDLTMFTGTISDQAIIF